MAAVRTPADGREKWILYLTKPTDTPSLAALTAADGIDISCLVAKSGSRITPTGSETINDAAACESTNRKTFGLSNYEGSLAPFLYFDVETGIYSMADNVAADAHDTEFVRPCNLCPHMKRISLENIYEALLHDRFEVTVDPAIAERARLAVERALPLMALARESIAAPTPELLAA